jgi:hypothetical protein
MADTDSQYELIDEPFGDESSMVMTVRWWRRTHAQ